MIVTCPACSAQYLLPDESVGEKGRRVKCTTCDYTWMQLPEYNGEIKADKPSFFVPDYEDIKSDQVEFTVPRKQRITPVVAEKSAFGKSLIVGLGLAVAGLLITLGFAAGMRNDLVGRFPATALLFEKIHIPVNAPGKGLSFNTVNAQIIKADGAKDKLNVSGKLSNDTKKNIKLQRMLIRVNGENGWLKDWPINLYGKVLQAGTSNDFTYDLKDIPEKGQSVTLLFAD